MYYIYHIPSIRKIGCTNNIKRRVEVQQGCFQYEILAKTKSLNEASDLEIKLQKEYGYKLDRVPYNKLKINQMEKLHVTASTVTFQGTKERTDFENYFSDVNEIVLPELGTVKINKEIIDFISRKAVKSMYPNMGMFIYNNSLWNFYSSTVSGNIYDKIRNWAKVRGIYDKGDSKTQYVKLLEEAGELAKAILANDKEEIIDAIGDCVVVLTNLAKLEDLNIEDCIESSYKVISTRSGKMENGTFVKNE